MWRTPFACVWQASDKAAYKQELHHFELSGNAPIHVRRFRRDLM
jgi:hypothetical protein